MDDDSLRARVLALLEEGYPVTSGQAWKDWCARARALGPEAIPILVEALSADRFQIRDPAQLCLRVLGVENWMEGHGPDAPYRVKLGEEWTLIRPPRATDYLDPNPIPPATRNRW